MDGIIKLTTNVDFKDEKAKYYPNLNDVIYIFTIFFLIIVEINYNVCNIIFHYQSGIFYIHNLIVKEYYYYYFFVGEDVYTCTLYIPYESQQC